MKKIKINLCIGEPDDGSRISDSKNLKPVVASFSRFVLPFAYRLVLDKQMGNDLPHLFYVPNTTNNPSFTKRRKYLSRETGTILYDNALWLDMCSGWNNTPWGKGEVIVNLRDRNLKMGMLPPRLVLFEAQRAFDIESSEKKGQKQSTSVLFTGFLLVDLYFPCQDLAPELDDLLQFNEFFRYFGMPYDDHAKQFRKTFRDIPVRYSGMHQNLHDENLNDFECYFERWANLLELPLKYKEKYYRLFPDDWSNNARKLSYNKGKADYDANWQIMDDTRTFVWTAAFFEQGGKTLQKIFESEAAADGTPLEAKKYGHWLKLLNIDPPDKDSEIMTHQAVTEFERNWMDKRTYKRWESFGTWYGFSYHSGAVIDGGEGAYAFAPFSSYYFDVALLLFYLRVSLFRFSAELTNAVRMKKNKTTLRIQFENIREEFLKFTILYQFPLLSNQQQNLEMYVLNREFFETDAFFKEIKQEIDNTHDFLESVESGKLAKAAQSLAEWGIPLAAAGVVTSIFGLGSFEIIDCISKECSIDYDMMAQVFVVIIVFVGSRLLVNKFLPKGE